MFTLDDLTIDAHLEVERIARALTETVRGRLRRRGVVLGLSGGIDSSVVTALSARALGPERVRVLLMPERDSSEASLRLGRQVARFCGVEAVLEDVGPALEAAGCYARQEAAIRQVFPDYGPGWRCKLTLPSLLEDERLGVSLLTVESPGGERRTSRMSAAAYRELVAATNFKQRIRKVMEYHHADALGYVVAGTPNRQEYELGFFVKQGDGAADVKPIAHLYKTQVYALAAALELPDEVRSQLPTTDTFSLAQTQEEFYFRVPHDVLDACLWASDHDVPAAEVGVAVGLTTEQVERVYRDIAGKRRATRFLHEPPVLLAAG